MREGVVEVDGSRGEGGGQILRTSLALSMITGKPLRMSKIRAGRAKPGLRRQHLACVHAARQLCGADVSGDTVGSQSLEFAPAERSAGVSADRLDIDIGTAGSTSLVVQTILVPAIASGRPLVATVTGGTHNPLAPPFDFLARVFVPQLRAMGADVAITLDRHGFAVATPGKRDYHDDETPHRGRLTVEVRGGVLGELELVEAGPITGRHATAILARLPTHVAERELAIVRDRLGFAPVECEVREVREGGPANLLMLEVERSAPAAGGPVRELVTVFGEKGLRAETVAERACDALAAYLAADVPVGEHLADQLLLPMAVAGRGRFRTAALSLHSTTNIETIGLFLDVPIRAVASGPTTVVNIG